MRARSSSHPGRRRLFDRYIQVVTAAIRDNGGHATSIAGDGIMSVFGVEGTAEGSVRGALQAAVEVWNGVDSLSRELASGLLRTKIARPSAAAGSSLRTTAASTFFSFKAWALA
jgi:class 3 adenylate cyclase